MTDSQEGEMAGVHVPTSASATYTKDEGPWTYWKGRLTALSPGDATWDRAP